jgi:hypothetical protein
LQVNSICNRTILGTINDKNRAIRKTSFNLVILKHLRCHSLRPRQDRRAVATHALVREEDAALGDLRTEISIRFDVLLFMDGVRGVAINESDFAWRDSLGLSKSGAERQTTNNSPFAF